MAKEYEPGNIERAIVAGDYEAALEAVALKTARTLDKCESTRDVRPLCGALFEVMDRMQQANPGRTNSVTPLDAILAEAERILANPGGNAIDPRE